jgi:hypothetical protein
VAKADTAEGVSKEVTIKMIMVQIVDKAEATRMIMAQVVDKVEATRTITVLDASSKVVTEGTMSRTDATKVERTCHKVEVMQLVVDMEEEEMMMT